MRGNDECRLMNDEWPVLAGECEGCKRGREVLAPHPSPLPASGARESEFDHTETTALITRDSGLSHSSICEGSSLNSHRWLIQGRVSIWPDWIMVVIVAAVFLVGQAIEGNILQPKLVGGSVGLHPVGLMFALFAFGFLFGFVGLLVAVPAAAAIAVLVRFAIERYLASPVYRGSGGEGDPQ